MRKITLFVALFLVSSVVGFSAFFVADPHAQTAKPKPQGAKPKPPLRIPKQPPSDGGRVVPKPAPDPTRATPGELDAALYSTEEFLGAQARVPRPFAEARAQLDALMAKYPQDIRLLRFAASLDEKLGNFDRAVEEMRRYTEVRKDTPSALWRLAAFYHGRAMHTDEARTLQKLAPVALPFERDAVYSQIARLVRENTLADFDLADFYRKTLDTDPNNIKLVEQYVGHLLETKKYAEARRALDELQPKYPNELRWFLKTRAETFEKQGDRRGAENAYASAFDPLWPRAIASDYYDVLRRTGRYRAHRREQQDKFLKSTAPDFNTATRLFNLYAYEGNPPQARSVVAEYEKRRGQAGGWTNPELETLAGLCLQIGSYDQASRFLYAMHAADGLSPAGAGREKTLAKLTDLLLDAGNRALPVNAPDISFYKDITRVDQGAGFLNGILSLILAGNNPGNEFEAAKTASVAYYNRELAARLYAALKSEYPASASLPELHAKLLDAYVALGETETVVKLGDEFLKAFPQAKNYDAITLKVADAEVRLGRRAAERARLLALLDRKAAERAPGTLLVPISEKRWSYRPSSYPPPQKSPDETGEYEEESSATPEVYDPSEGNDETDQEYENYDYPTDYLGNYIQPTQGITYASVLERVVSGFAAEDKPLDTLKFFYGEIKKYPREEGLHERLLKWLGQTSMVDEQLKLYTQAVRRFGSNTWYHRLARWFVRNEKQEAFEKYSRELVETLDDGDIEEYLNRFVTNADPNSGGNDAKLYLELYRFAHDRFPGNLAFVKGLMGYYQAGDMTTEWEKLAAQYYFQDAEIRDSYLAHISKQAVMRERETQAKAKAATSPAYRRFAADTAMWLSHHDEALAAYRELVKLYPGELQYAERLANLTRSLGSGDPKFYEESAAVWSGLGKVYPSDHRFPTQAGEVLAELGDFKRAGAEWDSILSAERGNPESYLEVASIYWDYFLYEDAVRTLADLRRTVGNPTAYAYQMGAIHEGRNKMDLALAEYVSDFSELGETRDKSIARLAQLAPRKDYGTRIEQAFRTRLAQLDPSLQGRFALGCAAYLRKIERTEDAYALLSEQVAKSADFEFLETVRDTFLADRRVAEEQRTLQRLVGLSRDEHETIKYRLQTAVFFERQSRADEAVAVIDKLVSDYPTNLGVLEESSRFYWRTGLLDKSIAVYQRSTGKAVGDYRRQFTLQLAKRQLDAGKAADAEKTLRTWYAENPLDTDAFSMLAKNLGETGQDAALADLYKTGLKNIAEGDLSSDERRMKTAALRLGLIDTLTRLKRYAEAIDQHIEIVNRDPEDAEKLRAALRYGLRYGQTDRFTAHYADLAAKADRNYRWNVVLGEIRAFNGDTAGAADQYRKATVNEPQRLDFRLKLGDLYARLNRFDDAIAAYRRGYELDPTNPEWLVNIARVHLRQDKPAEAVAVLREALATRKQAYSSLYFRYGGLLLDAGMTREALGFFADGFEQVRQNPYRNGFGSDEAQTWMSALVRVESPKSALTKLETLIGQLNAEATKPNNGRAAEVRAKVEALGTVRDQALPQIARDYATPAQMVELEAMLRPRVASIQGATEQLLPALNAFSEWMARFGLTGAQEAALVRAKDAAYLARKDVKDTRYHAQLQSLVGFYAARENFGKAVEVLTAEEKREKFPGTFEYAAALADMHRRAGDTDAEIAALGRYYRRQTGDLSVTESLYVTRYLNVLQAQGKRAELEALAGLRSPFQLQLINFLVKHREKDLARKAIQSGGLTAAWVASRSAQLETYFRNSSPEVETFYKQALGLRSIGERIAAKPNLDRELVAGDWYVLARSYGVWLTLDAKRAREVNDFLIAETEYAPTSSEAHRETAEFHRRAKRFDQAKEHIRLALELNDGEPENRVVEGAILFDQGDRAGAIAAWNRMIAPGVAGETYPRYLDVMIEHGLLAEALPTVEQRLIGRVRRPDSDIEDWAPLVRSLSEAADDDPKAAKAVTALLLRVTDSAPTDLRLGVLIVNEGLLSDADRAVFYESVHNRAADAVLTAFSNQDFYFSNYDYENRPLDVLNKVEKAWIDGLIAARNFTEAETRLTEIGKTRETLFGELFEPKRDDYEYVSSDPNDYAIEPEWTVMARAVVELRTNRVARAVERLRRYTRSNDSETEYNPGTTPSAYLHAHALLVNEGRQTEADALLGEFYQEHLNDVENTAFYVGLAEIEFRRGRSAEGLAQLNRFVQSRDEVRGWIAAAEVAAKHGKFAEAVEWRTKAAGQAPADDKNRFELARLRERAGDAPGALVALAELAEDRDTPNPRRLAVLEVLGEIARRNRDAAGALVARSQGKSDGVSQIVLALAQEAAGNAGDARNLLDRAAAEPYNVVARIERAQLARRENQPAQAVQSFVAALGDDPTCRFTETVRFADAHPLRALRLLYLKTNRPEPALRLTGVPATDSSEQSNLFESFNYLSVNETALPEPAWRSFDAEAGTRTAALDRTAYPLLADAALQAGELTQALALANEVRRAANTPELVAAADRRIEAINARQSAEGAVRFQVGKDLTTGLSLQDSLGDVAALK